MPIETQPKASTIEGFLEDFFAAKTGGLGSYEPREDTFLMLEALEDLDLQGSKVLDIGTGSGILAAYCARRGSEVTASDVNVDVVQDLRLTATRLRISMRLVVSDLFSKIDERFDIVVFNPPYLPSARAEDRTTDGGKHGTRIIKNFLKLLGQHLTENGFAMLLVSSLNHPEDLARDYPGLLFEAIRQRLLFFESIYVMRVEQKKPASVG